MSNNQEKIIGIHAVSELLAQRPNLIRRLAIQSARNDKRMKTIRDIALQTGVVIEELNKEEFDRLFDGAHQGVAVIAGMESQALNEKELLSLLDGLNHDPLLLILDGVTDPHNLGACLRSADAAGADALIIPKDKAVGLNATARKVACGAAETVNLVSVTNLARCLDRLKERGIWLVGAADQADKSLYEQDLSGSIALIMGSEGSGLRRLTRESCDYLVSIPMAGKLSSLNVSVATGVCLYEARRQRLQRG